MPGLVSISPESENVAVFLIEHGLSSPIQRVSFSWGRGNALRVSLFSSEPQKGLEVGKIVEVKFGCWGDEEEIGDDKWRSIIYGSVSPYALFQSRKNTISSFYNMSIATSSPYDSQRWEYVMEYSREIFSLLSNPLPAPNSLIDDPNEVLKKIKEPTCLKAAWELMEIFYADRQSQSWLPERLVDWLADYDSILYGTEVTVHSKLVEFQKEFLSLQAVEDNIIYWDGMSSALSLGWLEIVVKMLRMHGSYQLDQLGSRETENGLVEAVAVLISKMPRMRPELKTEGLGECFQNKSDFVKAWEKWRGQISKLDCSSFWAQCDHHQTREGLRSMLQIMLGNTSSMCTMTYNWIELYISNFIYVRPFTVGLESLHSLARKCIQLKPISNAHRLNGLLIGILEENTEVVLAECSKGFGSWMVVHALELLTTCSDQAEMVLHEERCNLGGISIEELHRLVYAQVLSSHSLTLQIAPIYLASCMRQGMNLLEILLLNQPVQHSQFLLKNIEICRIYELEDVSSSIMKMAGVYHWKHGRKGSGVFWLQQARDEVRLNKIAQQLFDLVGISVSDESFKQREVLIELLGSESKATGGLEFLHKYRDFKKSLQQVHDGNDSVAAQQAVEFLVSLMRNPSTPHRFWLTILYDSLSLLNWEEYPLLNVSQTNLLLNKLQELSMARLRPDFVESVLPPEALSSIRLALATNLGRAILEE